MIFANKETRKQEKCWKQFIKDKKPEEVKAGCSGRSSNLREFGYVAKECFSCKHWIN